MTNLNTLETFRTKDELINYFNLKGISITEKDIETLKKSYEQKQKNGNVLTLKQLDNVAGGTILVVYPGRSYTDVCFWKFDLKCGIGSLQQTIGSGLQKTYEYKREKGSPVTVYSASKKFDGSYEITKKEIKGQEADDYFSSLDHILLFDCNKNSYSFLKLDEFLAFSNDKSDIGKFIHEGTLDEAKETMNFVISCYTAANYKLKANPYYHLSEYESKSKEILGHLTEAAIEHAKKFCKLP